jgi:Ras-related protein Rab-21
MVLSVVGNKTDLESQRKVTREEAFQYAASIGGNYFESSALHDEGDVFFLPFSSISAI